MATKNICEVELLDTATLNTNVIVEDSGKLFRLNLSEGLSGFATKQDVTDAMSYVMDSIVNGNEVAY